MLLIKMGPLSEQEKTLFLALGIGPDGQMPTAFLYKLGWMKSKQLLENCGGLGGYWKLMNFDLNHRGHSFRHTSENVT